MSNTNETRDKLFRLMRDHYQANPQKIEFKPNRVAAAIKAIGDRLGEFGATRTDWFAAGTKLHRAFL